MIFIYRYSTLHQEVILKMTIRNKKIHPKPKNMNYSKNKVPIRGKRIYSLLIYVFLRGKNGFFEEEGRIYE
jgi:hypothetical protein